MSGGRGALRLVAAGDALVSQSLAPHDEPAYLTLLDLIRSADAGFVNLEGVVREAAQGRAQAESGGTWVSIDPEHLDGLAGMGFDLFATAQNHSLDFGQEGLLAMLEHLEMRGLTHAGCGADLALARRPGYRDTAAGRVALVSCSTSFHDWNRAGAARGGMQGRPGLSGLRVKTTLEVDGATFEALRLVDRELQLSAKLTLSVKLGYKPAAPEGTLNFEGRTVRRAEKAALLQELHPGDLAQLLSAVREAARQAEWVVFSVHSHEMGDGRLEQPTAWLRELARAAIEAGADAVLGHGPHVLRGVELHEGKPILYSLGNFVFQNETQRQQPADFYEAQGLGPEASVADAFDKRAAGGGFAAHAHYWESVLAELVWELGEFKELRLHPLDLGFGKARSVRGRPVLADPALGRKIIEGVAAMSEGFGARVVWDEAGYGVVVSHTVVGDSSTAEGGAPGPR